MPAWTNPDTVQRPSGGATLLTAWGDQVNDDLNFLAGTAPNTVATSETTASTTYVDLTTVGPAVTLTTGTSALVILTCGIASNVSNDGGAMSFVISGATTLTFSDNRALILESPGGNQFLCTAVIPLIGTLTAGSNTFTAKYRAVIGGTATFLNRSIIVIPLP